MNNNEEINVFWKNIEQIGEKLDILNKKMRILMIKQIY